MLWEHLGTCLPECLKLFIVKVYKYLSYIKLTRSAGRAGVTSVDMRHSGAGNPETSSSTHPHLETQLEVFSSPDPETGIIPAQLLEPGSVNSKESPSMCGRVVWFTVVRSLLLLLVRQCSFFVKHSLKKITLFIPILNDKHPHLPIQIIHENEIPWHTLDLFRSCPSQCHQ